MLQLNCRVRVNRQGPVLQSIFPIQILSKYRMIPNNKLSIVCSEHYLNILIHILNLQISLT